MKWVSWDFIDPHQLSHYHESIIEDVHSLTLGSGDASEYVGIKFFWLTRKLFTEFAYSDVSGG